MIFSFLDHRANARNALVCKRWLEPALDTLWRDVDELYGLFSLLAPLKCDIDERSYEFARPPDASGWKRFSFYSRRVRKLTYEPETMKRQLLQSVFDDAARTRTSLNMLPNLKTLHWSGELSICVPFMHSNIKHFVMVLPSPNSTRDLGTFFDDVAMRMPALRTLDIRSVIPMHEIESDMIRLLSGLLKLRKVIFPRYYFTTHIAESMSRLPDLGIIEFQYFHEQGWGDQDDTAVFYPVLKEGAFPSLWDLSFTVCYADAGRFLSIPFAPTNLTMLYIDSEKTETASAIHEVLTIVSENCQLLTALALVSLRDPSQELDDEDDEYRITMDTIKPLLSCPNLTSLEFVHQFPVRISQDDVELLASSWPSLESLVLNNEPVYLDKADLTLAALIPFAKHCPKLRDLGLFLDASSTLSIPPPDPSLGYPTFRCLHRLGMGVSIILDPTPVSHFLSQVIGNENCELESGITWETVSETPAEVLADSIKDRCDRWTKVGEVLPLLVKLRGEERERFKVMRREVEDLRMRMGVLKDGYKEVDGCIAL
ncbi:hypothetical protein BDQ17DRAFT_1245744 [Cyathus striatus]|nr:hypothetical protein BDQ17DRAFT_1245744 [Cyathus striatus]